MGQEPASGRQGDAHPLREPLEPFAAGNFPELHASSAERRFSNALYLLKWRPSGGGTVETTGWCAGCSPYQISAKLSRPDVDIYVSLHLEQDNPGVPAQVQLDVIEMKAMQSGMVSVNAEALAGDITRTGHASIYGIYFDTGKADIKPESDATLKEIAKLLQQDAQLKLYVVGHTDNVGTLMANTDLSQRRADAVLNALTTKYGAAAARLHAVGAGPIAPAATNDTEEGRAKNRRVELVKQ